MGQWPIRMEFGLIFEVIFCQFPNNFWPFPKWTKTVNERMNELFVWFVFVVVLFSQTRTPRKNQIMSKRVKGPPGSIIHPSSSGWMGRDNNYHYHHKWMMAFPAHKQDEWRRRRRRRKRTKSAKRALKPWTLYENDDKDGERKSTVDVEGPREMGFVKNRKCEKLSKVRIRLRWMDMVVPSWRIFCI